MFHPEEYLSPRARSHTEAEEGRNLLRVRLAELDVKDDNVPEQPLEQKSADCLFT